MYWNDIYVVMAIRMVSWIVTLDVLKSVKITKFYKIIMLNSNIRCIEILLAHKLGLKAGRLNSNIRCIEIIVHYR